MKTVFLDFSSKKIFVILSFSSALYSHSKQPVWQYFSEEGPVTNRHNRQNISPQCVRHCTALHWNSLHCTALHCTALHCIEIHCTALHCTALHCTALSFLPSPAQNCRASWEKCKLIFGPSLCRHPDKEVWGLFAKLICAHKIIYYLFARTKLSNNNGWSFDLFVNWQEWYFSHKCIYDVTSQHICNIDSFNINF